MQFNVQEWRTRMGRPLPPLLQAFLEWQIPLEYGNLGYAVPSFTDLSRFGGWTEVERIAAHTWGFLDLPNGSVIALCEAVQPAAVVFIDSEGDLYTLAESLEDFLLSSGAGLFAVDDEEDDEEVIQRQSTTMAAFQHWLIEQAIQAPIVPGQFDFAAYAAGDPPQRIVPGLAKSAPGEFPATYHALLDGVGPTFRRLCDLIGRTADDADVCAIAIQLFGKAPPQTIGHAKCDDHEGMYKKKVPYQLSFSRNVLNLHYPPIAHGKRAICPYLDRAWIEEDSLEPLLFGLRGEDMWREAHRRLPQYVTAQEQEDGSIKHELSLMLDPAREVLLRLYTTRRGTRGYVEIQEGRDLNWPDSTAKISSGTGLFMQWAQEQGWLQSDMFRGHEALLDDMARRQARPSQLVAVALQRGLWDSHLADVPDLRQFAFCYFHNMRHEIKDFWITADLKNIFGRRKGENGHDEPVLDDDPPTIFDAVFKTFSHRFEQFKQNEQTRSAR